MNAPDLDLLRRECIFFSEQASAVYDRIFKAKLGSLKESRLVRQHAHLVERHNRAVEEWCNALKEEGQ